MNIHLRKFSLFIHNSHVFSYKTTNVCDSAANLHKIFELYNSLDKKVKTEPLFSVVEVSSIIIFSES